MKPIRKDTSNKKDEREVRIARIFHAMNGRELTIDGVLKKYKEEYSDNVKINYNLMSVILKDMCELNMITKDRRTVKENKSGRIETKSIMFYKESSLGTTIMGEAEKVFDSPVKTMTPEKFKMDSRLTEPQLMLTEDEKKEEEIKKERMKKLAEDTFSTLTFSEALGKLYTGYKIVSAVSGNIYTIIDKNGQKGVTSSTEPGAIISFFPSAEMDGLWRILEPPKTCPYCNGVVKLIHETLGEKAYYYCCTNTECLAHGPRALTPEQAVIKFNQRV